MYLPGAPQDAENYYIYPVHDINIYVDKKLNFIEENPRIVLRNMIFFKEISITGVKAVEN